MGVMGSDGSLPVQSLAQTGAYLGRQPPPVGLGEGATLDIGGRYSVY
jgi:hypothetical protein